jgi:hypothetical protein
MYPRSSPELLKWIKPIKVVSGRTNENKSEIRDPNEHEIQRNNRYSGSSVALGRSGPRLLMTLNLKHFTLSSQKKYQQVLSFVQIPGKHTPASLHEDTSTVLSITVKNSTAMEKKIISMVWRDSGDTLNENWYRKVVSEKKNYLTD